LNIIWFRKDLRLADNPALVQAAKSGAVMPVFILDDEEAGPWRRGAASRVWLYHSLKALNETLDGRLSVYTGKATQILPDLVRKFGAEAVFWNRCYESWRRERDAALKTDLKSMGIKAESFNGSLLWEPWEVLKADGTPYRVFTPFYRKGCLKAPVPRKPLQKPDPDLAKRDPGSIAIEDLGLIPEEYSWPDRMMTDWEKGESGALKQLDHFLTSAGGGYKRGRDYPAEDHVSRLSPYLANGEISPNMIWHKAQMIMEGDDLDKFCAELGWREFSHSLLYHFPGLPEKNFQPKFDPFPWQKEEKNLTAWKKGLTGIPIIDAGMRELWQTGYMHNRVRMIVASFLIKNMMTDWRDGQDWFWDTLVDADLANNSAGWQWVAGSGADAAPYFRIFNPVLQSEKFDRDGAYIRRFVPEILKLPTSHIHAPWKAPEDVLKEAGIDLGKSYPLPIIDLKESRNTALAAYKGLP